METGLPSPTDAGTGNGASRILSLQSCASRLVLAGDTAAIVTGQPVDAATALEYVGSGDLWKG